MSRIPINNRTDYATMVDEVDALFAEPGDVPVQLGSHGLIFGEFSREWWDSQSREAKLMIVKAADQHVVAIDERFGRPGRAR